MTGFDPNGVGTGGQLSPDEDAALRRLHWFERLGCDLSAAARGLKEGLRDRDRRSFIRDPFGDAPAAEARLADDRMSYWVSPPQP